MYRDLSDRTIWNSPALVPHQAVSGQISSRSRWTFAGRMAGLPRFLVLFVQRP